VTPNTDRDLHDLAAVLPGDVRERRRIIAGTGLRILATTTGLLILYAAVPVPGTSGVGALIGLIVGFVVFVGLVGWQIRSILSAEHPILRGIEVVAFALVLLIVVFAFAYLSIARADAAAFSEALDHVGALYYTVSTVSTVGFGDISAVSDPARILVTVQMLLDLALIAGFARLMILVTRTGLRRQGAGPAI
jgi:voltage-gated potassium channel